MDDLDALNQAQLLESRNYEYWQKPNVGEADDLQLLNSLAGMQDAYGLSVPEAPLRGQQEFNRLTTGNPMSLSQQRYLRTREGMQSAQASNRDASFEQRQLDRNTPAPVMRFQKPSMVQGTFNPKHGQAIAFARALGFGQQIASNPANAELAYNAMTTMLRRVPLPVLLSPQRKQQTAMEFQLLLERLSQPPVASTSRPPVQPT